MAMSPVLLLVLLLVLLPAVPGGDCLHSCKLSFQCCCAAAWLPLLCLWLLMPVLLQLLHLLLVVRRPRVATAFSTNPCCCGVLPLKGAGCQRLAVRAWAIIARLARVVTCGAGLMV
jgi:hypothetical protein